MNKNLKKLCYAISAALLLFHLSACKDPVITDRGNSLDLPTVSLSHIDTCTVLFNTVADRPLISSGVSVGVLGSMNDAFFGKTYAGIYSQLLLYGNGVSFSNDCVGPTLDSAVLVMPFLSDSAIYGHCNQPMDIIVYEVSQDMIPGSTYYTNDAFAVYPQPIGMKLNYVPDLKDSVYFITPNTSNPVLIQNQSPELRIRLSNAFANKIIIAPDSALQSSVPFIEYIKGIYVTTNPSKTGNGLMYFGLNNCAVNLYYHHTPSLCHPSIDTVINQFQMSTYGVTVNHFDHYYGGTQSLGGTHIQSALNSQNPAGDKLGYIQAGGGTKLRLSIPYLKNIDSVPTVNAKGQVVRVPIGVTKAELIMPVEDTLFSDPSYHLPPVLTLSRYDDTATFILSSYNYAGAGYLSTRLDNNNKPFLCYVFNITEYVQRVFNGYFDGNKGYYVTFSSTIRGDRAIVLNDATIPTRLSTRSQLKITYTKLEN